MSEKEKQVEEYPKLSYHSKRQILKSLHFGRKKRWKTLHVRRVTRIPVINRQWKVLWNTMMDNQRRINPLF